MKKPVLRVGEGMKAVSDRRMFESRLAVMERFAFESNPIEVLKKEYEVLEESEIEVKREERIKEWSRKPYSNPRVNSRLSLPKITVDEVDQELECLSTDRPVTNVSNSSMTNVSNSSDTDASSFDISVLNSSESFEQHSCDLNTWLCDDRSADYLGYRSADYLGYRSAGYPANQSADYLDWSSSQSFVPFSSSTIENQSFFPFPSSTIEE